MGTTNRCLQWLCEWDSGGWERNAKSLTHVGSPGPLQAGKADAQSASWELGSAAGARGRCPGQRALPMAWRSALPGPLRFGHCSALKTHPFCPRPAVENQSRRLSWGWLPCSATHSRMWAHVQPAGGPSAPWAMHHWLEPHHARLENIAQALGIFCFLNQATSEHPQAGR